MERIKTDAVTKFTSKEFQGDLSMRGVSLALEAPDYQEMNDQIGVT